MSNNNNPQNIEEKEKIQFQQNIMYPKSEDIYNNAIKEADIDPANPAVFKTTNEENEMEPVDENSLNGFQTGSDLDIPGADLDDEEEAIGSEDEENNYYSIGGDNHDGLEEDKGE